MSTTQNATIYSATIWGGTYRIRANFSDAASQIEQEGEPGEWSPWDRQVADFSHDSDEAMREYLREMAQASGDDPEDDDIAAEIADAVADMLEWSEPEAESLPTYHPDSRFVTPPENGGQHVIYSWACDSDAEVLICERAEGPERSYEAFAWPDDGEFSPQNGTPDTGESLGPCEIEFI